MNGQPRQGAGRDVLVLEHLVRDYGHRLAAGNISRCAGTCRAVLSEHGLHSDTLVEPLARSAIERRLVGRPKYSTCVPTCAAHPAEHCRTDSEPRSR